MAKKYTPKFWWKLDPDAVAKNWVKSNTGGTWVEQQNRAQSIVSLSSVANYMASKCPRTMFCQSLNPADPCPYGANPLLHWKFEDTVTNATQREYRAIVMPQTEDESAESRMLQYPDGYGSTGDRDTGVYAAGVFPTSATHDSFIATRTSENAAYVDGLQTTSGYTVIALSVQDRPRQSLDIATDEMVPSPYPVAGGEVLEYTPNAIADTVHAVRTTNLPIIAAWSAVPYNTGAGA